MIRGNYFCSNPKADWPQDYYQIDYDGTGQKRIAIWNGRSWLISRIKKASKALEILNEKFSDVKKV